LIYGAKPQRGGRNIPSNTNNPPQDPPAPPIAIEPTEVFIPIENTAPPVPESHILDEIIPEPITKEIIKPITKEIIKPITKEIIKPITKEPKVSIFRQILSKLMFWRRK